jgi:hypothetical protein
MDRFVRLPFSDDVTHDVHPSTLGPGLITKLSIMSLLLVTVMMNVELWAVISIIENLSTVTG